MRTQNNALRVKDWSDIYPNFYKEAFQKAGLYPIKYSGYDLIINDDVTDPNFKYTLIDYVVEPDDYLSLEEEKVPMKELGLYAIMERRWTTQPTLHWVYKHFVTGKMYEIIAEHHVYIDDENRVCYGEMFDIDTITITDEKIHNDGLYLLLHDSYKVASRKYKIRQIV